MVLGSTRDCASNVFQVLHAHVLNATATTPMTLR
jgi:hypothetical protein